MQDVFVSDLIDQVPLIIDGLARTVLLAIVISVTGFFAGVFVFWLRLHRNRLVARLTTAYISFFVGMPLIVLLFLMYYGLPQWGVRLTPFAVVVIGFTFNIAAYNAGYLLSAYNGMDRGEIEAAVAQGFSELQIFRFIVLPQALRVCVPSLANQVIRNVKDTSLASLVQYTEFFARIQEVASGDFQFFAAYLFAGSIYLMFVSAIVIAARQVERRYPAPGWQP